MNIATLHIENCLDCPHCYTDRILTADSFEHEEGAYCRFTRKRVPQMAGLHYSVPLVRP